MLKNKNILKTLPFWIIISLFCGSMIYPASLLMPFNKKIFSISFLFAVIAIAGTCLILLVLLIDVLPKKDSRAKRVIAAAAAPLKWLGMNSLIVFILN